MSVSHETDQLILCPGCHKPVTLMCTNGRVAAWHEGIGMTHCSPVLAEDGGYAEPDDG